VLVFPGTPRSAATSAARSACWPIRAWDVPRAQRRLLTRVLQGRRGRLALLLAATPTGATAHQAGTVTLVLALGWQGRALPLVWRSWRADEPGQDGSGAIQEMLASVQALLPAAVPVVLLADRGLSGAPLAQAAPARGWHDLLRVQSQTRICHGAGTVQSLAELVPTPGTQGLLRDVHLWKKGPFLLSWATTPRANVVAVWRAVDREPWLLVTDLPATLRRCTD
jgi:hypothetical protein